MQQRQGGAVAQAKHHPTTDAGGRYRRLQRGPKLRATIYQRGAATRSIARASTVEAAGGVAGCIEATRPANELPMGTHPILGPADDEEHAATSTAADGQFEQPGRCSRRLASVTVFASAFASVYEPVSVCTLPLRAIAFRHQRIQPLHERRHQGGIRVHLGRQPEAPRATRYRIPFACHYWARQLRHCLEFIRQRRSEAVAATFHGGTGSELLPQGVDPQRGHRRVGAESRQTQPLREHCTALHYRVPTSQA